MRLHRLDREVLRVCGNAAAFLHGLTSNDLGAPQNAFLTIHGRIVAVFDQVKSGDDEFLLVFWPPFLDDALRHIEKYLRINRTTARRADLRVYFDLDGAYAPGEGEWAVPQKAGRLVVTPRTLAAAVSDEEFLLFRVRAGLPVQGVDFRNEFLLNVSETDLVSFTKGCYLGQEPVSKVHSRSKPSKKLAVVFEDECPADLRPAMTSRVTDPASGRVRGFVFLPNG